MQTLMIAVRKQEEKMELRLLAAAKQYSTDDDSAGSSEEMDSPRSVQGRRWRSESPLKKVANVHSQILRIIREEDSHLGTETSFGNKDKAGRTGLPRSPLRNTSASSAI